MHLLNPLQTLITISIVTSSVLALDALTIQQPSYATPVTQVSPRQGLPGRRISGGTRIPTDECVANQQPLIAMVPAASLNKTSEASPTFWFYLPPIAPSKPLEFNLFNQNNDLIYQVQLAAPSASGLVGINLAQMANAPTLAIREQYRWSLSVICNSENRSEDVWVDGWVQRNISPTRLHSQLAVSDPIDLPIQYLDAGLWYDAFDHLIKAIQTHPNHPTVATQWALMLQSANLDQALSMPLTLALWPRNLDASISLNP